MNIAKLKYKFRQIVSNISNRNEMKLEIDLGFIIGLILVISIIFFLSLNILNGYKRGKNSIEQLKLEQDKLNRLQQEGAILEEELEYRKSMQFVDAFANENLYLGKKGEKIYIIERSGEIKDRSEIGKVENIELDNHFYWWKRIFLW